MVKESVIVAAKRTPIGSFQGQLSKFSSPDLAATLIKAIIKELGLKSDQIDEVILGNVLTAGLGQAPARQAAILAGCDQSIEALTINKMCGSGLKAVICLAPTPPPSEQAAPPSHRAAAPPRRRAAAPPRR